jgi:hypothetical protein
MRGVLISWKSTPLVTWAKREIVVDGGCSDVENYSDKS